MPLDLGVFARRVRDSLHHNHTLIAPEQCDTCRIVEAAALDALERVQQEYWGIEIERDEARARLAEARRVQAECREKIYLALCDEDPDYNEWCGEVLPLIHDALLGLEVKEKK
jgi:hypothetical protein